jgi:hypothetical protein
LPLMVAHDKTHPWPLNLSPLYTQTIEQERTTQGLYTPNLMFTIDTSQDRIDYSWHLENVSAFISWDQPGSVVPLNTNIVAVFDVRTKLEGSITEIAKFSDIDLLSLIFGFIYDLYQMMRASEFFPVDCHPGNLLFKTQDDGSYRYFWTDFGMSLSNANGTWTSPQHRRAQFLKNIEGHFCIWQDTNKSTGNRQVQNVVNAIIGCHETFQAPAEATSDLAYFKELYRVACDAISKHVSHPLRSALNERFAGSLKYFFFEMETKLDNYTEELEHQKVINGDLQLRVETTVNDLEDLQLRMDTMEKMFKDFRRSSSKPDTGNAHPELEL